jgi:phosphomannomutase
VLKFEAQGGVWFSVRPSGTEPKLKIYVYGVAQTKSAARKLINTAADELKAFAEGI